MESMNASEFKAKCLAILDEVARTGKSITICKRGRPVARLIPPLEAEVEHPQRSLLGSVKIVGDIVSPLGPSLWEVETSI